MKEQLNTLYDYIIHSGDTDKMHVLGKVMKEAMCFLIDTNPKAAKEYIERLEAVRWKNYLTQNEADDIVAQMEPAPAWNMQLWQTMMTAHGFMLKCEPCYNECALYVTMCMISSDSGDTLVTELREHGVELDRDGLFKFVHRLALDKLKDKDGVFNIREYFGV